MGIPSERVLVCEDGDLVSLHDRGVEVERRAVPAGYQYVDGIAGDISHGVLRDRRTLGEEGFVVVIVTVDAGTGEVITGPEIVTRGWVYEAEADALLEEAKAAVRDALTVPHEDGAVDFDLLRRNARRALGRLINERTRRRPAVIPVILEV
jgi:ribonuclease J